MNVLEFGMYQQNRSIWSNEVKGCSHSMRSLLPDMNDRCEQEY